jgi:hypothetical protein
VQRVLAILAFASAAACGGGSGDDDAVDIDARPGDDDAAPPPPDAEPGPDAGPRPDAMPQLPGEACANAIVLDVLPAAVAGDTTGYRNDVYATCSAGSFNQVDVVYEIPLGATPVDVLAEAAVDEAATPPFDVVLYGQAECGMPDSELGCADAGWGERVQLLDASGSVFLVVDATHQFGGATTGAYMLTAATRAIVGDGAGCDPAAAVSRCAGGFRCVGSACAADSAALGCSEAPDLTAALAGGPVVLAGATQPFEGDFYAGGCAADVDAAFPERLFRIDVAVPSSLDASTDDPATDFDTYLYLRRAACDGAEVACADDVDPAMFNLRSHLVAPALAPDVYYLVLDGSSAAPGTGSYQLTVALTPL